MSKGVAKPRKISCLTDEQNKYYASLKERQRKYIHYRVQGYDKTKSYRMAGYDSANPTQTAYIMEKSNKGMAEIIETMTKARKVASISDEKSVINKQIDALATQESVESALATIDGCDGETARQIQFYRDIVNGKIKSVRVTKKLDALGNLVSKTVEEINDIDSRMKARRELDRILGLNALVDIDQLKMGDITINIVDASKKEELEDSRNKVELNPDDVKIIDGEKVIVEEEKNE